MDPRNLTAEDKQKIEHALLRPYPPAKVEKLLVHGSGEMTGFLARRAAELVANGWVDRNDLMFTGGVVVKDKPMQVLVDLAAMHGISRPNEGETEGDYGARIYVEELEKIAESAKREMVAENTRALTYSSGSAYGQAVTRRQNCLGGFKDEFTLPRVAIENVSTNTNENGVEAIKNDFLAPLEYTYDYMPQDDAPVGLYFNRRLLPQQIGILALPYFLERALGVMTKHVDAQRLSYRSRTLIVPFQGWPEEIGITLETWKGVEEPTPLQKQLLPAIQAIFADEYNKSAHPTMAESPYAKAGFFMPVDHDAHAAEIVQYGNNAISVGGAWSRPLNFDLLKVDLDPRRNRQLEKAGRPELIRGRRNLKPEL